jgi:hypothetical protein
LHPSPGLSEQQPNQNGNRQSLPQEVRPCFPHGKIRVINLASVGVIRGIIFQTVEKSSFLANGFMAGLNDVSFEALARPIL